VFRVKD